MTNYQYEDLSDLFGVYEESAQTPINTLNKMFGISGNPLFLYLTGVMDANGLRSAVQSATWEPVDISNADYFIMEQMNVGDPVLAKAYQLIKQGVSVNAAMRSMLNSYNEVYEGDFDKMDSREAYLEYALNDITEFKTKWDNAQKIEGGVNSGEYVVGPGGSIAKRMDPVKAADVLKQMGMPGVLQNPFVWEVVPDEKLLAIAASKDEYAQRILKPFERMIDPVTGMIVQKEAQKMAKQATGKAQSAYEMMLNKTPEGREYLDKVKNGQTLAEKSQEARDNLIKGPATNAKGLWNAIKGIGSDIVEQVKGGRVQPTINQIIGSSVLDRDVEGEEEVNQDDYWAKLAASYAGRAEQERLMKPVNTARKNALGAAQEAQQWRQASVSPQRGTTPAVSILNKAFPLASALSQSGAPQVQFPFLSNTPAFGGLGSAADAFVAAKKDPRLQGLTKQQIDLFSTLFASGR